jgi:hypothetical protein
VFREWTLETDLRVTTAGTTVRFGVLNEGLLPHALAVEGDGLYLESDAVGAGDAAEFLLTFDQPGRYDLFCPVAAGQHRALGQEGVLLVVAPGANAEDASSSSVPTDVALSWPGDSTAGVDWEASLAAADLALEGLGADTAGPPSAAGDAEQPE